MRVCGNERKRGKLFEGLGKVDVGRRWWDVSGNGEGSVLRSVLNYVWVRVMVFGI